MMNKKYSIHLAPPAIRQLKKLVKQVQLKILKEIQTLATDPRPNGVKKLSGIEGFYRIRIGDYRVIYEIEDKKLSVLVVKVGNRKDIYS